MRTLLCGIAVCLAGLVLGTPLAYPWDYPLDVCPEAIRFNHNTASGANDALTIRRDNGVTIVTAPEYSNLTSPARRDSIAYALDSTSQTVLAVFSCFGDMLDNCVIDAQCTTDNFFGLSSRLVSFNGSAFSIEDTGNPTNYVTLSKATGSSLPSAVGRYTFSWQWRVSAVEGQTLPTPVIVATTRHGYYGLLSVPKEPMTQPWIEVLENACIWAANSMTEEGVVYGITCGAYNSNFKNYWWSPYSHVSGQELYLTNLLADTWADCQDMAAIVQVYSNALGVSYYDVKYGRINGPFTTKVIDPMGNPDWQSIPTWVFHQVGWYGSYLSTNAVYDACIRVDQTNPRIPTAENVNGEYRDSVYDSGTWVFNGTGYITFVR